MKGTDRKGGDEVEDNRIVELYFERSETAISETRNKYGKYCRYIAYNILNSELDAEECENDTYLRAWEAIPPERPKLLKSFLGRITRNLALDRLDRDHAQKRGGNVFIALEEIGECVPASEDGRAMSDEIALRDAINEFLGYLPRQTRIIFLRRYWYLCSISDISNDLGLSESNVKVILMRTRKKFREHLEKEGISV